MNSRALLRKKKNTQKNNNSLISLVCKLCEGAGRGGGAGLRLLREEESPSEQMLRWQAPEKWLHVLRARELIIDGTSSPRAEEGNTVTQPPAGRGSVL